MDRNEIMCSANLHVLARQATLRLRSPMNTDPDPFDLPILREIAALTARARTEFERLIREHRGYGVGDTVQFSYEAMALGNDATKWRVLGFEADPDFDAVALLARIKNDGTTSSRVDRKPAIMLSVVRVAGSTAEAA
jgi:hypothetical protein